MRVRGRWAPQNPHGAVGRGFEPRRPLPCRANSLRHAGFDEIAEKLEVASDRRRRAGSDRRPGGRSFVRSRRRIATDSRPFGASLAFGRRVVSRNGERGTARHSGHSCAEGGVFFVRRWCSGLTALAASLLGQATRLRVLRRGEREPRRRDEGRSRRVGSARRPPSPLPRGGTTRWRTRPSLRPTGTDSLPYRFIDDLGGRRWG